MSTASQVLAEMPWMADYNQVVAAANTVNKAIKRQASIVTLIANLWIANRKFKALLLALGKITKASKEDLVELLSRLRQLNGTVNDLLKTAQKHGYRNRTLTNVCFHTVDKHNVELLDFIDAFGLSLRPDLDGLARQALSEYHSGETVSLESILE